MAQLTRRNALRLLGLAAASSFAPSLFHRPAHAGPPTTPRRILFFYTEQGTLKQINDDGSLVQPYWSPMAAGLPDPFALGKPWSTGDFTLRDIHQPLLPHQKNLLFLENIDMLSAAADASPFANAHIQGETHALVAANRATDKLAGGISIDQHIAKGLNSPSPVTSLPSLEALVDPWQNDSGNESSPLYSAPGQPIPLLGSPKKVYQRLLPNGPQGSSPEDIAKQKLSIARQKSVIEHAYTRYKAVGSKLGSLDRARLDAHADALKDLEGRLDLGAKASCVEPDPSITDSAMNKGDGASYTANADLMIDLSVLALACDLTRVVTLNLIEAPGDLFGYHSVGGTTDFHDMVHKTNGGSNQPLLDDPEAIGIVKAYHTLNSSLFAKLLDKLAAVPEGDGTSLLDNTLVVWCGQIAGGDHSLDRIPYILAGKLQGAVTPGRYVVYPRKKTQNWPTYSDGVAHNDLFVSLANVMGVPTEKFGNPDVCTGPLPGLS